MRARGGSEDFAFQLSKEYLENRWSQIDCDVEPGCQDEPSPLPWAFAREAIAMLSSVLRSDCTFKMNVRSRGLLHA